MDGLVSSAPFSHVLALALVVANILSCATCLWLGNVLWRHSRLGGGRSSLQRLLEYLAFSDAFFHGTNVLMGIYEVTPMFNEELDSFEQNVICLGCYATQSTFMFSSIFIEMLISVQFVCKSFALTTATSSTVMRFLPYVWVMGACSAALDHLLQPDDRFQRSGFCRYNVNHDVLTATIGLSILLCILSYVFTAVTCCIFGGRAVRKRAVRAIFMYSLNYFGTYGVALFSGFFFRHLDEPLNAAQVFGMVCISFNGAINALTYSVQLRYLPGFVAICSTRHFDDADDKTWQVERIETDWEMQALETEPNSQCGDENDDVPQE
eukprot:TRINITY_DN46376_c0_g1_i1.p1 TRINITY_DN46376_c0_g1~~TRINITY_DN46376_c0_g1_i1.p1  ORF type:complete len:335 (+),score=26.16 TRINITY_DN46376_c0_g1_i1:40-1005(+)